MKNILQFCRMDCRIFCSEIKESMMNMPLMGGEKGNLLIGSKPNACLLLLDEIGDCFFQEIFVTFLAFVVKH